MIFLVVPPIFAPFFSRGDIGAGGFSVNPIVFFNSGIAFLIYVFLRRGAFFEAVFFDGERKPHFVYASNALLCFGVLCLSAAIFEGIAILLQKNDAPLPPFPNNAFQCFLFILKIPCAAFFEEVIYRLFLPISLKAIFARGDEESVKNRRLSFLCEILSLILFAAGHFYLGVFGFLNALIGGIALRVCLVRTKSLWLTAGLHTAYNAGVLSLSFLS